MAAWFTECGERVEEEIPETSSISIGGSAIIIKTIIHTACTFPFVSGLVVGVKSVVKIDFTREDGRHLIK